MRIFLELSGMYKVVNIQDYQMRIRLVLTEDLKLVDEKPLMEFGPNLMMLEFVYRGKDRECPCCGTVLRVYEFTELIR